MRENEKKCFKNVTDCPRTGRRNGCLPVRQLRLDWKHCDNNCRNYDNHRYATICMVYPEVSQKLVKRILGGKKMEELLITLTQAIVNDCEQTIKTRLQELGDTDLFEVIKAYAEGTGLLESYKFKEQIVEEVRKEVFEEVTKREK